MQTRISVYKLYTKSKALYIQIHQAAASLSRQSQTFKLQLLHLCSRELRESESLQQVQTKSSNMSFLRGLTASGHCRRKKKKKQLSSQHLTRQDLFLHKYKGTNAPTHTNTNKHYTHTHAQTLYTIAHAYIHNHSMAL